MQGKNNTVIKRIVDVSMTVLLLCLMAYQVTGEALHEWIGIGMTVLVIVHQILNRKWHASIFKGMYTVYRIIQILVNVLLFAAFALTAVCGMSMSAHAVPKLYGLVKVVFARKMHLSMSYWAFILMGVHLGLHIPMMAARFKLSNKTKNAASVIFAGIAGYGLYLFLQSGISDYMFFKTPFAFLDYEKSAYLVFFENIMMLIFWAFIGTQTTSLCKCLSNKNAEKKNNPLLPIVFIMSAVLIGMIINAASPAKKENSFGTSGWGVPQAEAGQKTGGNGQSLTAIAKLAPDADMGEGLSVHYSGEPTLSEDVSEWLDINEINR